jgi:hypothetical protein
MKVICITFIKVCHEAFRNNIALIQIKIKYDEDGYLVAAHMLKPQQRSVSGRDALSLGEAQPGWLVRGKSRDRVSLLADKHSLTSMKINYEYAIARIRLDGA